MWKIEFEIKEDDKYYNLIEYSKLLEVLEDIQKKDKEVKIIDKYNLSVLVKSKDKAHKLGCWIHHKVSKNIFYKVYFYSV